MTGRPLPTHTTGDQIPLDPERSADPARAAQAVIALGGVTAFVQLLGPLGGATDALLAVVALVFIGSIARGVRRNRPDAAWTWWLLCASLVMFALGTAAGSLTDNLGDTTGSRTLLPDACTLSGYALVAASMLGMTRNRYRNGGDRLDVVLDATIASLATLCLTWVFFIGPALSLDDSPASSRLVLVAYPVMSSFIAAVSLRLAFSAGRRPGFSFRALLAAAFLLLLGDVLFTLADLGMWDVSSYVAGVPYTLAQAATVAAALHPSMRELTSPVRSDDTGAPRRRLAVVVAALAVPGLVAITENDLSDADRFALAAMISALVAAAVWRTARALDAHARSEERLARLASHDSLTGLPNRSHLMDRLPRLIDEAHRNTTQLAVLFLDIDRFKYVNDSLGHIIGDEVLITVAHRLRAVTRPDDIVARLGGDEFFIVLPSVSELDEALAMAERVRRTCVVPVDAGGSKIVTSVSIGVAMSTSFDHSVSDLIRDADSAMYQAKSAGRNVVAVFDESMLERAARRLSLEAGLRVAIAESQMRVVYQPLVTLPDGLVEGFEALLRWDHPEMGPISPEEFIPIAEDTGLIIGLGAWVLDTACHQLSLWTDALPSGTQLHMSVNVSARQLSAGGFAHLVAATLERHGLPSSRLWLELTESLLLDESATADGSIELLRELGVRLAADDFGTGFSSLSYLKRFPVDRVKVDREFVGGLADGASSDGTLIAAIVAMSDALGMATIAEGVETVGQATELSRLGVGAAQGYLFSRPLPPEEIPVALSRLGTATLTGAAAIT